MNIFGFRLSPSSTIDLDKVDRELYDKLCSIEPSARYCMACGSCSATCTSARYTGMSMRKVLLDLQRGRQEEAAEMISACMLCGKCTMICPRGINTRRIILTISQIYKEDEEGRR